MIKYSHNKKCFACGQPRPKNLLGYDLKTLKTYCTDNRCLNASGIPTKELHPLEAETLELVLKNNEDLNKLIGKSVSARLQPYLAMHILETAKIKGFASINETLLYILDRDFISQEYPIQDVFDSNFVRKDFSPSLVPLTEGRSTGEALLSAADWERYQKERAEAEEIKIIINDTPITPFEEVHKQVEEEAPIATPEVQEILDQVSKKLEEEEEDDDFEI